MVTLGGDATGHGLGREEAVVRWDGLFADLEAQLAEQERAERAAEIDERTRGEIATLLALDRLRAGLDQSVVLRLHGHGPLTGTVRRVGPDWLLLEDSPDREVVVAWNGVLGVRGLARFTVSAPPGATAAGIVAARLGLRHALRGIARDRAGVRLLLRDGAVLDATLDRVGADFVEAAVHAPGEVRRREQVRHVELVPLHALVAVRRAGV